MKSIDSRLGKLEALLIAGDESVRYEQMTSEERRHRVAELIYKRLDNPAMTQEEYVTMFMALNDDERMVINRRVYKDLTGKVLL